MKFTGIFLAAAALGTATPPGQEIVNPPSLGPRYKQTRERADVLFALRDGQHHLPETKFSLFRPAPEAVTTPSPGNSKAPPPKPIETDQKILNEALAVLKKGGGGIVTVNGRAHLTFNQKVYRPGDAILVPLQSGTVQIEIVLISHNNATLALNESEVVWRF